MRSVVLVLASSLALAGCDERTSSGPHDAGRARDAASVDAARAVDDGGVEGSVDASRNADDASVAPEDGPIGWASVEGGTSGGAAGETVTVRDADTLRELAASDAPLVIRVEGRIDVGGALRVASDKTLLGVGADATIRGNLYLVGRDDAPISNIIVRNLHIDGSAGTGDDDAMRISYADHVWVDHCDVFDGRDGALDIIHASDFVTISWTRFRYTAGFEPTEPGHFFAMLIGNSDDNADEDRDRLRVTLHHNWWSDRVVERMPRVRFGDVHAFNNHYDSGAAANYAVRAGVGARVLLENEHFDGVDTPHELAADDAELVARGSRYDGISASATRDVAGEAFEPPYAYVLDDADDVAAIVDSGAGPR